MNRDATDAPTSDLLVAFELELHIPENSSMDVFSSVIIHQLAAKAHGKPKGSRMERDATCGGSWYDGLTNISITGPGLNGLDTLEAINCTRNWAEIT